jgi:hypothetical protein
MELSGLSNDTQKISRTRGTVFARPPRFGSSSGIVGASNGPLQMHCPACVPIPTGLLLRDRRTPAQQVLLDLAGRRFRQLADEGDALRNLEVSKMLPPELADFIGRG